LAGGRSHGALDRAGVVVQGQPGDHSGQVKQLKAAMYGRAKPDVRRFFGDHVDCSACTFVE